MEQINKEKIYQYIQEQIEKVKFGEVGEVGEVLNTSNGIVKAKGLKNVLSSELVEIQTEPKVYGMVLNLEEDEVGIIVIGDDSRIKEGTTVKRTQKVLSIPVGEKFIGRVIDPLGNPLDGKGAIESEKFYPVERKGLSVIQREPVKKPLHTGILAVDAMIPIGRGQRELILGDRTTGKTAIVLDAIMNQKNEENRPVCIYVAIGQKKAGLRRTVEILEKYGAMDYTTVVATSSSDPASFLYLAPYSGTALGEYFMDKGKDVLVIYDDLTKHAQAWRQISLLLRRPPGREAYPGDVFYLHSRLLERAAKANKDFGGGSLTSLPIIETQASDITSYIPTNVISITDGQIYLASELFYKGQRPAINIGLSVSRVGSAAQTKLMKSVAGSLRLDLAQFKELEAFVEFSSDVDKTTRQRIERGKRLMELLKQINENPLPYEKQAILILCGIRGYFDDVDIGEIQDIKEKIVSALEVEYKHILQKAVKEQAISDDTRMEIQKMIRNLKTV